MYHLRQQLPPKLHVKRPTLNADEHATLNVNKGTCLKKELDGSYLRKWKCVAVSL